MEIVSWLTLQTSREYGRNILASQDAIFVLTRSCFYSIVGNPFQNIIIVAFLISFGGY